MQMYTVRTEDGMMVATLTGTAAEAILDSAEGEWRTYTDTTGKTVCYELTSDMVWTRELDVGEMKLFYWAGWLIIKDIK